MKINRLTWAGFGLALIGWALLIADMVVSDTTLKDGNLVAILALRGDILTIAQTMILSGFGLAIVGTLRSGFGAFTRFFDAVLQRSSAPRSKESTTLEPEPLEPELEPTPTTARAAHTITITPKVVTPERSKPAASRDKNYVILSDGSVEVETMFGTRIFANLSEAKDFIR
ncbi:hypothetical protein [Lichenifustis flavocetrariae]|uniref:Uncharacterized protein n=1 Tax=Lichenifustis flavocetrariae TaxID=2949735 RepID=A0AA41YRQ7_9HYPH|nr:hypothetical protein [Lichenifustis flavocetrariae]MCW6507349.1 hypothetical protein [Lichenifustis flavocetrariae]